MIHQGAAQISDVAF